MKFSTSKGEYVRGVARAVADGTIDLAALTAAPSEDVIRCLTALHGLGRWTAEWFINNSSVRSATYSTNPTITQVGLMRFESAAGSARNFTLTVVPEPGTSMLLGLGLAGLSVRRRSRS